MSATTFYGIQDNAETDLTTSGDLDNTTSPITVTVDDGTECQPTISLLTLWDRTTYGADPEADPNMEEATCTATSGDNVTLTRPNAVAHPGAVHIAQLPRKAHFTQMQDAINGVENARVLVDRSQSNMPNSVNFGAFVTGLLAVTVAGGVATFDNARLVFNEALTGDVDGVNDTYTLQHTPSAVVGGAIMLFLNGAFQRPGMGNDYTISGNTVTFASPPPGAGGPPLACYLY